MTTKNENNAQPLTLYRTTRLIEFEINCQKGNVQRIILLKSIESVAYCILNGLASLHSTVSKTYEELCEMLSTYLQLFIEKKTVSRCDKRWRNSC